MKNNHTFFVAITAILLAAACKNNSSPDAPSNEAYQLSYGDSVIYLRSSAADYMVAPKAARAGSYEAFPKGLSINPATGVINVSQSETGMRYKITFRSTDGEVYTTN